MAGRLEHRLCNSGQHRRALHFPRFPQFLRIFYISKRVNQYLGGAIQRPSRRSESVRRTFLRIFFCLNSSICFLVSFGFFFCSFYHKLADGNQCNNNGRTKQQNKSSTTPPPPKKSGHSDSAPLPPEAVAFLPDTVQRRKRRSIGDRLYP